VIGAAQLAVLRCREVAGARIRSKQNAHPDLFTKVDGKPNALVAALIGYEGVTQIEVADPLQLVFGGTDSLAQLLLAWGYSQAQVEALAEMIRVHAARTLFEQDVHELPSGLVAQIERMMEVSDAMADS
jgi:hypothetical protein